MSESTHEELRCFCSHETLLAVIKRDSAGKPFVHIKIYKAKRIFGEIIFVLGEIEIRCRDCWRWHKVRIVKDNAVLSPSRRSRATRLNLDRPREPWQNGLRGTAARA